MQTDDHEYNANEEPVAKDTLKHIDLIIEASVVENVKNLHPDEDVEDEGVELQLLICVREVITEDISASEVEDKDDGKLVDVLASDLLLHGRCDERLIAALRWAIQNLIGRRIGSEGEGGEGVHDQVHPQKLNCAKYRYHIGAVHSGDES